jgi:hypothetical protein
VLREVIERKKERKKSDDKKPQGFTAKGLFFIRKRNQVFAKTGFILVTYN